MKSQVESNDLNIKIIKVTHKKKKMSNCIGSQGKKYGIQGYFKH